MAISLPNAFKTDVYGTGDGYIVLKQDDGSGNVTVIYLTLHQFQTIWNHEKHLTQEALNVD